MCHLMLGNHGPRLVLLKCAAVAASSLPRVRRRAASGAYQQGRRSVPLTRIVVGLTSADLHPPNALLNSTSQVGRRARCADFFMYLKLPWGAKKRGSAEQPGDTTIPAAVWYILAPVKT